jgi:hypothetical protein
MLPQHCPCGVGVVLVARALQTAIASPGIAGPGDAAADFRSCWDWRRCLEQRSPAVHNICWLAVCRPAARVCAGFTCVAVILLLVLVKMLLVEVKSIIR